MQPKPSIMEVLKDRRVPMLLAIVFLSQVSQYMVLPFMAVYLRATLHFPLAVSGFLVGLPYLIELLFGVVGGFLIDRLGSAKASIVAMLVSGLAYAGIAVVHDPLGVGALLIVSGAVMGVVRSGPAAMINRVVASEHRGMAQNYQYWIANVGILVGLLLSAEVLQGGHSGVPFVAMLFVRVIQTLVVVAIMMRSQTALAAEERAGKPSPGLIGAVRSAAGDRALLYGALAAMMLILIESQLSASVPLRLSIANGIHWYGPLMAIDSVIVVICQPLAMKFMPSTRPYLWFAIGSLATALGLALGGFMNTIGGWVIGMVLYSLGEVIWSSKLNDLLGELPPSGQEGLYFSTVTSTMSLGVFAGTWAGSALLHVPHLLFGGLLVVAVAAAVFYRASASHLRIRAAREQALASEVTRAGMATAEPASETHNERDVERITQGIGAAYAPHPAESLSDFGIPMPSQRMVLLESLSREQWDLLLSYMTPVTFKPGDILVESGAVDRTLYLVEGGQMEVLVPSTTGTPRRLTLIETGAVFGEQAFVDGSPRSAAIRSVTAGTVLRLDWENFLALADAHPDLGRELMVDLARILSERLRHTTQYLAVLETA